MSRKTVRPIVPRPELVAASEQMRVEENPLSALLAGAGKPLFSWTRHQERDLFLISHPTCEAVFSRQGGQLLHFQPKGQRPWLWCAARWPRHGAIRGGVPVCWPWFSRHPTESGWPSHGWARLSDWELLSHEADATGVRLHWRLDLCEWQVDLHAELGAELRLRLVTQHQDSEPCQLSHALHGYWRVGDMAQVAVRGLEPAGGYDLVARADFPAGAELRFDNGCHRVYRQAGRVELEDQLWRRRLQIDTSGGANTVVWHPGARPLADVGWHEALGFVSVQAASCREDSVTIGAGETAELRLHAKLL
jgi:D-hexose-6-phosphate mutarotase